MRKINSEKLIEKAGQYCGHDKCDAPFIVKRAQRSAIYDNDNNCYTDYYLACGSLILGHAFPNSVLAVKKTAEMGIGRPLSVTKEEIDLSRFLIENISSVERVSFFPCEKEAVIRSIFLSRRFSGRKLVMKFEGSHDFLSDHFRNEEDLISLPYNDLKALKKALEEYKDSAACVIIEPVVPGPAFNIADKGFLKELRGLTLEMGILLVFDEINTCFRTNAGGFQHEADIKPDLSCFGGIFSSGFLTGAIGGRKDVIGNLSPVLHLSPVLLSASLATLKYLKSSFYERLDNKCGKIKDELDLFFDENGIDARISRYGSLMHIKVSGDILGRLSKYLLKKGIFFPDVEGAFYVSLFHSALEIDRLVLSIKEFFNLNKI